MVFARLQKLCVRNVSVNNECEYIVPGFVFDLFLKSLAANVVVNESWYLQRYADVAEAMQNGSVSSATEHYRLFGFRENRQPYPIQIDETFYLKQNPDVEQAVKQQVFASGQQHFEQRGFQEGRLPYRNFSFV